MVLNICKFMLELSADDPEESFCVLGLLCFFMGLFIRYFYLK